MTSISRNFQSIVLKTCLCVLVSIFSLASHAAISFVASATVDGNDDLTDITVPAGALADDLLLAQITYRNRNGGDSVSAPAGWTQIGALERDSDIFQAIYYRIASASDAGTTYRWDFEGNGSRRFITGMSVFRGVDTSNPIEDDNAQDGLSSFTVTAPSVNVATNGSALVGFYTLEAGNQSFTATASMTEIYDVEEHNTGGGVTSMAAYELNVSSGASGVRNATSTRNSDDANGFLIALNPGTLTFPAFSSVDGSCGANQIIIIEFSADVSDAALNSSLYTLSNGSVTGVSRQSSNTVILSASGLVAGDAVSVDFEGQNSGVNYQGILGTYFDQRNGSGNKVDEPAGFLTGDEFYRLDPQIDFDFGSGTPSIFPNVSGNNERFSIRWSGSLVPDTSGSFEFRMRSDDGVILNLDGAEILRDFSRHAPRFSSASPAQTLLAGESYEIEMVYFEHTGQAVAELEWRRDGGAWEVIPTANLSSCASASSSFPDIAFWNFNQTEWTGLTDEVLDSGRNAYHGTAINGATTEFLTPAISTDPGTCQYGVFDDAGPTTGNYIEVPNFPNLTTDFTITAWIRTQDRSQRGQRIFADDESGPGYSLSLGDPGAGRMRFFSRGIGPVSLDTNEVIQNDTWYFVAGVADITNRTRTIYVFAQDGSLLESASISHTGNWAVSNGTASIGGETNSGEVNNRFNGNIDSVRITSGALAQSDIETLITRTQPCGVFTPVLEYRFDEFVWNGTAGEVSESASNSGNGTAVGGAITIPQGQICYAGQFDGIDDYVEVGTGTLSALQSTSSLSFWIQTTQTGDNTAWRAPGVTGVEQAGGSDDIFWGWIDAGGRIGVAVANDFNTNTRSSTVINDGVFHHVVLTRDAGTGAFKIYVDGVLERDAVGPAGNIGNTFSSIGRIEDTGGTPAYFRGVLDEVRVYDTILDDQAVLDLFNDTRACANACVIDSFNISQPNFGLACPQDRSQISIQAICPDGTVKTDYDGTVDLTTNENGSSLFYASASSASAITSVTFDPNDMGEANVFLFHDNVNPALRVTVTDALNSVSTESTNATEFGANGFVIGTPSPFACSSAGSSVTLTAIGQTGTGSCQQLTGFSGTRNLKAWSEVNIAQTGPQESPPSGAPGVILDNGSTTFTLGDTQPANNNVQNINFTNGQASIDVLYNDVGQVTLNFVHDDAPYDQGSFNAGTGFGPVNGNSNAFIVYPEQTEVSANTAGSACNIGDIPNSCSAFVAAGQDFQITTKAVCAGGATASSFRGNVSVSDSLLAPTAPNVGDPPAFAGNFSTSLVNVQSSSGEEVSTVNYSEVGVISISTAPLSYFGLANIVGGSSSAPIGRFTPASFALSSSNGIFDDGCTGFTYIGQPFAYDIEPSLGILALNTAGATTRNYTHPSFLRLTGARVHQDISFPTNGVHTGADGTVLLFDRTVSAGPLTSDHSGNPGVLNYEFNSTDSYNYVKDSNSLVVPFDNADETITITHSAFSDLDGVSGSPTSGWAPLVGEHRYGRWRIENVFGPENESLAMLSQAEFLDTAGFVVSSDDECTVIGNFFEEVRGSDNSLATIGSSPINGIVAGGSTTNLSFTSPTNDGLGEFNFSAPGEDGSGSSVTVELNFDTAPWLQFDWDTSSPTLDNPPVRSATFGQFRGHDRIIYWREVR